jgi:excisionase family DNA binding protein
MKTEWLTRDQVAELLQVGDSTVRRWTDQGRLPAYRFAGVVRYKREDVDAMAELVQPRKRKRRPRRQAEG